MNLGLDIAGTIDLKVDSTGDIAIVSDLNCVTQDMNILLGTATKELTFTPNFGIGLIYFQNKPFNMSNQAKLSNRISQSLLADDRIKEINSIIFEHDEFTKITYVKVRAEVVNIGETTFKTRINL